MELLSSINDVYGLYNVAYNVVGGPVRNPVIACFSPRHIGGGGQRILLSCFGMENTTARGLACQW